MKTAILVHGRPNEDEYSNPKIPMPSNDHWLPWLSKELSMKGIHPYALEIPRPFQPRYEVWKKEFERFDVDADTVLVGHSCGGGFLVRWLSENPDKKVGRVVLVAPWINPSDSPAGDTADFFHFDIDANMVAHTAGVTLLHSTDDMQSIVDSVKVLRETIKDLKYVEFENMGHFVKGDMGKTEFPELLQEILS